MGEVDDDAKMRNADEDDRLKVFHLFSRIHGDLERDYNDFEIEPTFFSNVRKCFSLRKDVVRIPDYRSLLFRLRMMRFIPCLIPGARKFS